MPTSSRVEDARVADGREYLARLRELTKVGRHRERDRLLWENPETVRHYLCSLRLENVGQEFMERYVGDALARFFHTIELVGRASPTRALELGSNPYLFTLLLKKLFDCEFELANFFSSNVYDTELGSGSQDVWSDAYDERHSFSYRTFNIELSEYPYPEESFDLVLFCEILEHLVIDPLPVFAKLRRLLRPGGHLLLTTPNAVRLINFAYMLAGRNYFDRYVPENGIYGRHNREFTARELGEILTRTGFRLEILTTRDRYNYNVHKISTDTYEPRVELPYTADQLREILEKAGGSAEDRGDNVYVLAQRID